MTTDAVPASAWRTSSYSASSGQCVEVAPSRSAGWCVRDSKFRALPAQLYSAQAWSELVDAVKAGSEQR